MKDSCDPLTSAPSCGSRLSPGPHRRSSQHAASTGRGTFDSSPKQKKKKKKTGRGCWERGCCFCAFLIKSQEMHPPIVFPLMLSRRCKWVLHCSQSVSHTHIHTHRCLCSACCWCCHCRDSGLARLGVALSLHDCSESARCWLLGCLETTTPGSNLSPSPQPKALG